MIEKLLKIIIMCYFILIFIKLMELGNEIETYKKHMFELYKMSSNGRLTKSLRNRRKRLAALAMFMCTMPTFSKNIKKAKFSLINMDRYISLNVGGIS
ncbi:hypothetical protein DERF_014937 [Dermatophagoides farinae]|uniref:Uncharacterized protein n=1 Tax=Dermatophagoides farinae TaxID=6954 RepID=A0A922HNF0_DERFA|nr:hypothetical protein DERF_014937 [Dermatophagoides farinae]